MQVHFPIQLRSLEPIICEAEDTLDGVSILCESTAEFEDWSEDADYTLRILLCEKHAAELLYEHVDEYLQTHPNTERTRDEALLIMSLYERLFKGEIDSITHDIEFETTQFKEEAFVKYGDLIRQIEAGNDQGTDNANRTGRSGSRKGGTGTSKTPTHAGTGIPRLSTPRTPAGLEVGHSE